MTNFQKFKPLSERNYDYGGRLLKKKIDKNCMMSKTRERFYSDEIHNQYDLRHKEFQRSKERKNIDEQVIFQYK